MSKEKLDAGLTEDLEKNVDVTAESTTKSKKEQTPEDREVLVAGTAKIREFGVSENLSKLLELVPEWNGDKELLPEFKNSVIEKFGGSENLKDFIDGEFQNEMKPLLGFAKSIPVLNNIKSFYGRRATTTKKPKMVQISISGVTYNVDAAYRDEIAALPQKEKKELLLAHEATTKAPVIEEIL